MAHRRIQINYENRQIHSLAWAYRRHHPNDVFPVTYQGWDRNWDSHIWYDLDGESYFADELIFVEHEI